MPPRRITFGIGADRHGCGALFERAADGALRELLHETLLFRRQAHRSAPHENICINRAVGEPFKIGSIRIHAAVVGGTRVPRSRRGVAPAPHYAYAAVSISWLPLRADPVRLRLLTAGATRNPVPAQHFRDQSKLGRVVGVNRARTIYEAPRVAAQPGETVVTSTCGHNCGGRCVVNAHVRDGRIVKISTDPRRWTPEMPPLHACVRGFGQHERVNHPDRLKHPLRRTGPRGSGQFERIAWDEALDEVARQMLRIRATRGGGWSKCWTAHFGAGRTTTRPNSALLRRSEPLARYLLA